MKILNKELNFKWQHMIWGVTPLFLLLCLYGGWKSYRKDALFVEAIERMDGNGSGLFARTILRLLLYPAPGQSVMTISSPDGVELGLYFNPKFNPLRYSDDPVARYFLAQRYYRSFLSRPGANRRDDSAMFTVLKTGVESAVGQKGALTSTSQEGGESSQTYRWCLSNGDSLSLSLNSSSCELRLMPYNE